MGRVVLVGGGMVGTCAAMMLAHDGHEVTVLERDAGPPPSPEAAWDDWDRRGVNQFRMIHYLLSRFRMVADAELPGLTDALVQAGALRSNPMTHIPDAVTGGWRDGDGRFELVTARRPVAEAVVAAMAAATPGLTIRRGVAVRGLLAGPGADGVVHVRGVVTDSGEELTADVVVDSGGRRSAVPAMLRSVGSPGPIESVDDSGFVYFARHFRSADGSVPPSFGPNLHAYGSLSTLTLPADNGTWGLGIAVSAKDAALRSLSDADTWTRVVRAYPLIAHWAAGEPITDVKVMAKLEDRRRDYLPGGVPVATGVLPLADAWACTNPSLGRGISIGITHAATLRSVLRDESFADPRALAVRYAEATDSQVGGFVTDTLAFDRHRLAEIESVIDGEPYEPDDPAWTLGQALSSAAAKDPDLLRAAMSIGMVLERGRDVLAGADTVKRVLALADPTPLPGPDRAELLALVGG